jgi:energy-converting hydrogenase Eha subunit C
VFHMVVAKVYRDVAYVASVSEECCKHLFKMFHLFQTFVASIFYLDIAHVSHIRCKSMFEMFEMFQSYVVISVFML